MIRVRTGTESDTKGENTSSSIDAIGGETACVGRRGAILAVSVMSSAILVALVACLGRFGSLGERQGGAVAAQGPSGGGAMHATERGEKDGWSHRRLQKPC